MTPYTIAFQKAGEANSTVLTAGQHFRFDIDQFESFFYERTPTVLVDLLRIASAVYVVDRLVRRRRRNQQRHWSRSILLNVGVLEPDFWSANKVQNALAETIEFLTDDTWDFTFSHDDRRASSCVQKTLFGIPLESNVCLYSGGLDSAAGLANRIAHDPATHVLPVTVWHQPVQRRLIQKQHNLLRSRFDVVISPLTVKTALIWTPEVKRLREEPSQRSRAFLFTAAGAVAAALADVSSVEVYESGIGAINLPFMAGMVGSRTTRSAHPEFLRKMSDLVSLVAGKTILFNLPFMHQTKGQVVKTLIDCGLSEMALGTVSCVHYPLRESRHKQCGVCPACIFRRQAMFVAGIQEPKETYKYDLFDSPLAANRISPKHLDYLKAFLNQVVQLDEVKPKNRLPTRVRRHLIGTGILTNSQSPEPIVNLLSQYRNEWQDVAARAASLGFSWTKFVGQRSPQKEGANRASA